MTQKLKVSIQLNLEIPIENGPDGHRKSPTQLIAPYIDRLYHDMRYQGYEGPYDFNIGEMESYHDVEAQHFSKDPERLAQMKKDLNEQTKSEVDQMLHEMWKEGQNLLTLENYGISWDEYVGLSDEKRAELHQTRDLEPEAMQRLSERTAPHEAGRGN